MISTHREQRGAGVTKAWRGVRRIERACDSWHGPASRRVASCRVEDSRAGLPTCGKSENIAHRSDLASLCVIGQDNGRKGT